MLRGRDYRPACVQCTGWKRCYPDMQSQIDNVDSFPCPHFRMVKHLGVLDDERVERRIRRVCDYVESAYFSPPIMKGIGSDQ